jgi:hypothetical protein
MAPELERCRAIVPFHVHRASTAPTLDKDSFRGLASVFGHLIDTWVPTRILPGAFTKTLKENSKRVKVLFNHDPDSPIGIPTKMEETREGLLVEAKISQTEKGKEVLTLMRDGVLDELSIGFDVVKYSMADEGPLGQVRHISELRLWEFSPVTFAANSQAKIIAVHSRGSRAITERVAALDQALAAVTHRMAARQLLDAQLAHLDAQGRRLSR